MKTEAGLFNVQVHPPEPQSFKNGTKRETAMVGQPAAYRTTVRADPICFVTIIIKDQRHPIGWSHCAHQGKVSPGEGVWCRAELGWTLETGLNKDQGERKSSYSSCNAMGNPCSPLSRWRHMKLVSKRDSLNSLTQYLKTHWVFGELDVWHI